MLSMKIILVRGWVLIVAVAVAVFSSTFYTLTSFSLKLQTAYELMTTWEENCLDHLKEDEIKKFRPSIANFDCMRDGDDIEKATKTAEAKYKAVLKIRKQKEEKEREKNMKVGLLWSRME